MLYLDIQKGKKATKTAKFQQEMIGTEAFMKRTTMYIKRCGQLTSNYTYFADNWLSGMKTSEEAMAEGVYYCRPLKTSHKGFCLATL